MAKKSENDSKIVNDDKNINNTSKPPKQGNLTNDNVLSDEQINLALKDDRVYQSKRFKSLIETKNKYNEMLETQKEAEKTKLKEDKKWEELAGKYKQEAEVANKKVNSTLITADIKSTAIQMGVVDADAVLLMIDKSNIKQDENGVVSGVKEAIEKLVADKPYLIGKKQEPIGSNTNPSKNQAKRKFKHSEIQNPDFFAKHEKEIMKAISLGQVENDVSQ